MLFVIYQYNKNMILIDQWLINNKYKCKYKI